MLHQDPEATMKTLLNAVLLLMLASVSGLTQEKRRPAGKVEYSVASDSTSFSVLRATANGKTYELIDRSKRMCLQVVDQRDFDGNGLVDALVRDILGCGGNCCGDSFFFVSNLGSGRFELSDEVGYSWGEPVIEKWRGRWSVVVTDSSEGVDNQKLLDITQRFILESGKAVQVEEWTRKEMESITEIRSEIFDPKKCDETHSLEYDLDGDGKKDQIITTYWSRWGRMIWTVEFADGKKYSTGLGCKRIGVLATKTNGVSDLVCDQDMVFRWNGREYQKPDSR
jgi:hypothetical protein